jgi:hypothetical protein
MLSEAARKRFVHHRDSLIALENAVKVAPPSEIESLFLLYQLRLGQIQEGWRNEMRRRARMLGKSDGRRDLRVWDLVENIRAVFGDDYADMAAEIAVSVLEPLQRHRKPLSAYRAE